MQKNKLKLIAAGLVTVIGLAGVSQIASAQSAATNAGVTRSVQAQGKVAQTDLPEAGDTADVPGAAEVADPSEAGETPDVPGMPETSEAGEAAEPAGAADTDNVQDGDQSGPETPDAPGAK